MQSDSQSDAEPAESVEEIGRRETQILSKRETEVVKLIGEGKRVGEIAVILGLSVKTISTFRGRALYKLGCTNNNELAWYAINNLDARPVKAKDSGKAGFD